MDSLKPLEGLSEIDNASDFVEFLDQNPECLSDQVLSALAEIRDSPAGPSVARVEELLMRAREDPYGAFLGYQDNLKGFETLQLQFEQSLEFFDAAYSNGFFDEAVPHGERALEIAIKAGALEPIVDLRSLLAKALFHCSRGDRSSQIEQAIVHLEAAGPYATSREMRASMRADLGALWGRRILGDPRENQAVAKALTQQALVDLGDSDNANLRATIEANLAKALADDSGQNALESRREAVDLAKQALAGTDLTEDPDHWAHCQINLAAALEALSALELVDDPQVELTYRKVVGAEAHLRDKWLVAFCLQAIGRIVLERSPDSEHAQRRAGALFEEALEKTGTRNDWLRGQVLCDLAGIQWNLRDKVSALNNFEEALSWLPLSTSPVDRRNVAFRLGGLRAEMGEDQGSMDAYEIAVEAAEVAYQSRLYDSSRRHETVASERLYRWASAAFHKAGRDRGAMATLETGRARELGRRLEPGRSLLDELADVPTQMRERYLSASERVRLGPMHGLDTDASRELSLAIEAIRAEQGHEDFAASFGLSDIRAGATSAWPIVYINPSPAGTSLMLVSSNGSTYSRFLGVTSGEIWNALASPSEGIPTTDSFLAAASEDLNIHVIERALDRLLPWLGELVGIPLVELLDEAEAENATIVPCGPIALVPLSAVGLPGGGHLLDRVGIRFAPSARVMSTCLSRVARKRSRHLVALADSRLAAAAPEIEAIAAGFDSSLFRVGEGADSNFMRANASSASHLHLACHGAGGLWDFSTAGIELADGIFSASEIATLGLTARLVVASACQTGISQIGDLGEECYSLASSFLAAGAACSVASHWSVSDVSTAFLMSRFYAELETAKSPAEGLCRAQQWLKKATSEEIKTWGGSRPGLAQIIRHVPSGSVPFRSPVHWAAFAVYGP